MFYNQIFATSYFRVFTHIFAKLYHIVLFWIDLTVLYASSVLPVASKTEKFNNAF